MQIKNINGEYLKNMYNKLDKKDKDVKSNLNQRKDSVEISNKNFNSKDIKANLATTSEIREEKVNKIKEAIDSGQYQIDSKKLAQKMLEQIKNS